MAASTQVALALHEARRLYRYETTIAYHPEAAPHAALRALLGPRYARVERELQRRAIPELPARLVRQHPLREWVRVAASRMGADRVLMDRIWRWVMADFDRHVASGLGPEVTAIYGYEQCCRASFERARDLGVRRIFDMAAPHARFVHALLDAESARHPQAKSTYDAHLLRCRLERDAHRQAELDAAELVIANSSFTARTLTDTGYPAERVQVVPLAGPPPDPRWRREVDATGPLRCIFAGSISRHKGAVQLLEAWRSLRPGAGMHLTLVGGWGLPDELRDAVPHGVELTGHLLQDALFERYLQSDVFVFPSLCDGFAMVVTEALAHGLPVITTRNVGAADLIEEGVNGWVLEPGDVEALATRLEWCASHRRELASMREAAVRTAASNQWSDYRARLLQAIDRGLGEPR